MSHPIDPVEIKQRYPIAEVVARYGIDLRPSGRALVGRCPLHDDRGRPNFYVYPASASWYCYRCAVGGDVIRFVERREGVGFRAAVARLLGETASSPPRSVRPTPLRARRSIAPTPREPDARACLAVAVELYHRQLLADSTALDYVTARGLDPATIERYRLGYASGDELAAYLHWHRLSLGAALRVGLLGRDGREFLRGRVIVPEIRCGQPIWLVGRSLDAPDGPKYLGLPGRKPLLGWGDARAERVIWLTEGPFDWLTLRRWGFPALALVGTSARAAALRALGHFTRVYLVLDQDEAGRVATTRLQATLGDRARVVTLPWVKDLAELGTRADGRASFVAALRQVDANEETVAESTAA